MLVQVESRVKLLHNFACSNYLDSLHLFAHLWAGGSLTSCTTMVMEVVDDSSSCSLEAFTF